MRLAKKNALLKTIDILKEEGHTHRGRELEGVGLLGTIFLLGTQDKSASALFAALGPADDPVPVPVFVSDSKNPLKYAETVSMLAKGAFTITLTDVIQNGDGKIIASVVVMSGFDTGNGFHKSYLAIGQMSGEYIEILYDGDNQFHAKATADAYAAS